MAQRIKRITGDGRFAYPFAAAMLACTLLFAVAGPAYADIAGDINAWLCGVLRDTCNWIFEGQVNMLKGIGAEGVLSASFTQMLGSAGSVTMYDIVHGVWQVAILPIGCGILGFVFTVQLIKISQRMDGNASMPGVKEVVFLLVFFAVFLFLIQNSFELMRAVYEVTRLAISRVAGLFGTGGSVDLSTVSITTTDDDVAALLAMLVVALVSWLVVIVAYVVALVVSWARAIQIYVMAAFSPIPLALMSLDETRQMGVGYLKNFAAVCLAGVIILVLLVSFPVVLGGLNAASAGVPVVDSVVGGLSYALQYLAMCILLILALVKSGSWSRDIMGG
ncbi:MAG: conjugal transfer protein TrbL [Eggerthellaceae bacterium]|nr:conjugal transfer protein TrbL [Eggerthellaceae bacterium]